MKYKKFICLFLLVMLSGCFPGRSYIVLLPDADGNIGELYVKSGKRTITVDKAYQSITTVPLLSPRSTKIASEQKVETIFSKTMEVEPEQRYQFKKETLYCLHDSDQLTVHSQKHLARIVEKMRHVPPEQIFVIGYTDRIGSEPYNYHLSRQRALSVRNMLINKGLVSKIISVSFFGEKRTKVETLDEVREPKNRRVELVLKYRKTELNDNKTI